MPFVILCGGCKRKLKIPDALLGKIVKCPHCARKSKMPAQLQTKSAKAPAGAKSTVTAGAMARTKTGAPRPTATKTAPVSEAAQVKKGTKAAPSANGPAAKPTAAKSTSAIAKKPSPAPAKRPAPPPPVEPPPPEESTDFETDALPMPPPDESAEIEAGPPPVRPQPLPKPPPPAPARKPARRDDDDEGGFAKNKLVVFGGAFVGVVVLGWAFWWLFLSEPSPGEVSGVATVDGKPLDFAEIKFIPDGGSEDKARHYGATSQADGKFQVVDKVPPGKYRIVVQKFALPDGTLGDPRKMDVADLKEKGWLKNQLPPDYADFQKTQLRHDVRSGGNRVEIKLTGPPAS